MTATSDASSLDSPAAVCLSTRPIPVHEIADQLDSTHAAPPRNLMRQVARFGTIGVASTLAYLIIFSALSGAVGPQWANLVALLITAIANTAANRRFTFGVRGRARTARHHSEALVVFALALAITSGSLGALQALVAPTPRWLELAVVVAANFTATALRFTLLRGWVLHPHRA